jgi:hypothetical protein
MNPYMQPNRQTQANPSPDVTPQAPSTITITGPDGKTQTIPIPRTRAEVQVLRAQREELSDQLINVSSRREELAREILRSGDGPSRTGLEERLRVLDQRILQLETDLANTGRQLASAPADVIAATQIPIQSGAGDDFEEGVMAGGFSVLVFMSAVLLVLRRRWKRRVAERPSRSGSDSDQRLARLEHGMDAIAIEIERVSEGQRFVTKLLSESQSPLGAPQRIPQPASVKHEDPAQR